MQTDFVCMRNMQSHRVCPSNGRRDRRRCRISRRTDHAQRDLAAVLRLGFFEHQVFALIFQDHQGAPKFQTAGARHLAKIVAFNRAGKRGAWNVGSKIVFIGFQTMQQRCPHSNGGPTEINEGRA